MLATPNTWAASRAKMGSPACSLFGFYMGVMQGHGEVTSSVIILPPVLASPAILLHWVGDVYEENTWKKCCFLGSILISRCSAAFMLWNLLVWYLAGYHDREYYISNVLLSLSLPRRLYFYCQSRSKIHCLPTNPQLAGRSPASCHCVLEHQDSTSAICTANVYTGLAWSDL